MEIKARPDIQNPEYSLGHYPVSEWSKLVRNHQAPITKATLCSNIARTLFTPMSQQQIPGFDAYNRRMVVYDGILPQHPQLQTPETLAILDRLGIGPVEMRLLTRDIDKGHATPPSLIQLLRQLELLDDSKARIELLNDIKSCLKSAFLDEPRERIIAVGFNRLLSSFHYPFHIYDPDNRQRPTRTIKPVAKVAINPDTPAPRPQPLRQPAQPRHSAGKRVTTDMPEVTLPEVWGKKEHHALDTALTAPLVGENIQTGDTTVRRYVPDSAPQELPRLLSLLNHVGIDHVTLTDQHLQEFVRKVAGASLLQYMIYVERHDPHSARLRQFKRQLWSVSGGNELDEAEVNQLTVSGIFGKFYDYVLNMR